MMRSILPAAIAALAFGAPAQAGPAEDAAATVTTVLDKFNGGDVDAFKAAHAANAVIIDEFGQHLWTGPDVAQRWLEDYGKDATARGISGGRVDYAAPIRASSDGKSAYVVLPTIYRFTQGGKAKSAAGTMTFVLNKGGNHWKIASWTYSAPEPN
jgi:ketosteroid isomerase-like protein